MKTIVNFIIWGVIIFLGLWLIGNVLDSIHTSSPCDGMTEKECEAYEAVMGSRPEPY